MREVFMIDVKKQTVKWPFFAPCSILNVLLLTIFKNNVEGLLQKLTKDFITKQLCLK